MRHQKVERIEGGVWSLPVPIPDNPLGYTLVYLIETDAGPVLIDAGWHSPAGIEALEAGITEAGFEARVEAPDMSITTRERHTRIR